MPRGRNVHRRPPWSRAEHSVVVDGCRRRRGRKRKEKKKRKRRGEDPRTTLPTAILGRAVRAALDIGRADCPAVVAVVGMGGEEYSNYSG